MIQSIFTQNKYEQKYVLYSPEIFWRQSEIFTSNFSKLEFWTYNMLVSLEQYMNQKIKMCSLVQQKKNKFKNLSLNCGTLPRRSTSFFASFQGFSQCEFNTSLLSNMTNFCTQ